jgi:hypothetical protein
MAPPPPLAIGAPSYTAPREPGGQYPAPGPEAFAPPRRPAAPEPVADDEIEDAEMVEDEAEAVGQNGPATVHHDAIVYPLRHARSPRRGGGDGHAPGQGGRRFSPAVTSATPATAYRTPPDGPPPADGAAPGHGAYTLRAQPPEAAPAPGRPRTKDADPDGTDGPSGPVPWRLP